VQVLSKKANNRKYLLVIIPAVAASIVIGVLAFPKGEITPKDNLSELILGGSPMLGDPNAPLTIVEWGDYQCTYCHRFHTNTKDAVFSNFLDNGKVRFVFKDFTLNGPASVLAAEASYCAGDQNKYWSYHDALYDNWEGENTGWVNMHNLKKFATNVGLDLDTFDDCLQSSKYRQKVLDNYKYGQSIGVNATPTFHIVDKEGNVQVIRGAQPYTAFEQVLGQMLTDKKDY
jgi:protein-disulfide isomerase